MTVLVEKYIELPFEYSSDEEALEYIETLMMLWDWQAVCDVIRQDSAGALVDCPAGLPTLYFDDEMQVVLFKVNRGEFVTEESLAPVLDEETGEWGEQFVTQGVFRERTTIRAASYLPERDDDA